MLVLENFTFDLINYFSGKENFTLILFSHFTFLPSLPGGDEIPVFHPSALVLPSCRPQARSYLYRLPKYPENAPAGFFLEPFNAGPLKNNGSGSQSPYSFLK